MQTARCYDCGLVYEKFPADMVVADSDWRDISPTGDHGGLLCPNCMCARFIALGATRIQAVPCYPRPERTPHADTK